MHTDSRYINTVSAPNGLWIYIYIYMRLLFGVNMATERIQKIVWPVIKDCPGAYNLHDDLRVVAADGKEHEADLKRVMINL